VRIALISLLLVGTPAAAQTTRPAAPAGGPSESVPPELGGPDTTKAESRPMRKPGPKDDGVRAATIRVDRPAEAAATGGAGRSDPGRPR
jgi:hypothetical protein